MFTQLMLDCRSKPILFLLSTVLKEGATVVDASATLGKFVNDELLHIQDSGGQSLEPSWFSKGSMEFGEFDVGSRLISSAQPSAQPYLS